MDSSGLQSTPVDSSGLQLTPVDSSELQWTPVDSSQLQWTPVDSSGLQWTPVESTTPVDSSRQLTGVVDSSGLQTAVHPQLIDVHQYSLMLCQSCAHPVKTWRGADQISAVTFWLHVRFPTIPPQPFF